MYSDGDMCMYVYRHTEKHKPPGLAWFWVGKGEAEGCGCWSLGLRV